MTKDDAIKHFGSQAALAEALGMKQPSVSEWGDSPPALRQIQIEAITGGALRADSSCYPNGIRPNALRGREKRRVAA